METDARRFAELKRIVKGIVPDATSIDLETTDQATGSGFLVMDVIRNHDRADLVDQDVIDKISDEASDVLWELRWNASVGEDKHGYAEVDLTDSGS